MRYLQPVKQKQPLRQHSQPWYPFSYGGREYTIFATSREMAQRIWDELIQSGEVTKLCPNA